MTAKSQPRPFTEFLWLNLRSRILLSWAAIAFVSVVLYSAMIVAVKTNQLRANLKVASEAVDESLRSGDWSAALGYLRSLEKREHLFEIRLKGGNRGDDLAGPFGQRPTGLGRLCHAETISNQWMLYGCARALESSEFYTAAFFLCFSAALFGFALKFFQSKMVLFVAKVADELKSISSLNFRQSDETTASEIVEVEAMRRRTVELLGTIEEASEAQALARLSVQIAHDIRSPLDALDCVAGSAKRLPVEDLALLRSATSRIRDMGQDLLQRYRNNPGKKGEGENLSAGVRADRTDNYLIANLIAEVVAEKRVQFRGKPVLIQFEPEPIASHILALVDPSEFMRVISNLLNNSIEAVGEHGTVTISLKRKEGSISVEIADTGKGISPEIRDKIGMPGATFGKAGGCGLGLHHARTSVEGWGGELKINSKPGNGTVATLDLPRADSAEPPEAVRRS